MLICKSCGHIAEEGDGWVIERYRDYVEGHLYSEYSEMTCPDCGSEDIAEATECNLCGEYHDEDNMVLVDLEYAPTAHEPEWTEDTIEVCRDCCDEYFADGRTILFDLAHIAKEVHPKVGTKFTVSVGDALISGICIHAEELPKKNVYNYIMHVEDDE